MPGSSRVLHLILLMFALCGSVSVAGCAKMPNADPAAQRSGGMDHERPAGNTRSGMGGGMGGGM